jgi:hypothetical protein
MKMLILPIVLFLSACNNSSEPVNDVDYYLKHEQERKDKLEFCNKSASNQSINCANAREAKSKEIRRKIFNEGFEPSKK